ncbi:putative metal-binding motif-containing protein [Myxococcota bacterium]|nr:putative metal-binding motif-containing protein [Myxococcota bacterium]
MLLAGVLGCGGLALAGGCDDLDGDGWPSCEGDCDDTDPSVSPLEEEACGDGVDNDCDGTADAECDAECTIELTGPADGADLTAGASFRFEGDCAAYRLEISAEDTFPADSTYYFGSAADAAGTNRFTPSSTIWSTVGRIATSGAWWRVVGGMDGRTQASETRSFFTTLVPKPPPPPPEPGCTVSLDSPADGSEIDSAPNFRWSTTCTGAYVEVSTAPDFPLESTLYFGSTSAGRFMPSSTLWDTVAPRYRDGGYWRVTAGAAEGPVSTEAFIFTTP